MMIVRNKMTTIFIPLFVFTIFVTFTSAEIATCSVEKNVIDILQSRYNVTILEESLNISYEFNDIYVRELSNSTMQLLLTTSVANFSGFIVPNTEVEKKKINVNFNTKPITARIVKGQNENNCKLTLSENYNVSMNLPGKIEATIIQLTEQCIQTIVCNEFDTIVSNDLVKKFKNREPRILKANRNLIANEEPKCRSYINEHNPQEVVNSIADFSIDSFISHIITDEKGIIKIPEILFPFETGASIFLTTGEFTAKNGTFGNLKSIERIDDLILKHDDLKFSIASTFRLGKLNLHFDRYDVRYGVMKIDGKLTVSVDGVTIKAHIAFDFNQKPCKLDLISLEKVLLGDVNVDMTGLWILNGPAAKIIEWQIKKKAYDAVKDAVEKKLNDFDCEQFRP